MSYDPVYHRLIRGFPRATQDVNEAEKMLGGTLVEDCEASLIYRLDTALDNIRVEANRKAILSGGKAEYPESLQMPEDSATLYLPIPFIVKFHGMDIKCWHKPAWIRIRKSFLINMPKGDV